METDDDRLYMQNKFNELNRIIDAHSLDVRYFRTVERAQSP